MPLNLEKIRAICFDLDGTLSDSDDVMVENLARFLGPIRSLFPKQDACRFSRRLIMAIESPGTFLLGIPDFLGLDRPLFGLVDNISGKVSRKHARVFKLVSGVREMLAELSRRYLLAIISIRNARTTNDFLEQFSLMPFFKCVASAQTCRHTKPFPDPILWAAKQMQVPPEACLMVGDTIVDIQAGKAAGAQTIGLLCGFGEEHELRRRGADMILSTTSELARILL